MNNKIGIITFHKAINYGAVLQSYALQKKIEEMGYTVEIIDYVDKLYEHYKIKESGNFLVKVLKRMFNKYIRIKQKKFQDFIYENLNISDKTYNKSNIETTLNQADYQFFLTGSDQVWNPQLINYDNTYFLNFVKDKKKCISYAASIGKDFLEKSDLLWMQNLIKNYFAISVRETSAIELLEKVGVKNVVKVCDPTILLDNNDWRRLEVKIKIPKAYILVYSFGNDMDLWHEAFRLSEQCNLPICYISDTIKRNRKLINLSGIGPGEWLYLIDNAKYLFTNSYHGVLFSLIFHTNFWLYDPKDGTNGRMYELLKDIDLENRCIQMINCNDLISDINFDNVQKHLETFKRKSLFYINFILKNKQNLSKSRLDNSSSNTILFEKSCTTNTKKHIRIEAKCTGCTLCVNNCPVNAISMKPDAKGSMYPVVNETICIECKKCLSLCPNYYIKKNDNSIYFRKFFALKNKNFSELYNSSSGGAYILFAKKIIENGGIVYGVKYEGVTPVYGREETFKGALNFCKTKYVEVEKGEIFKNVKADLQNNKNVLFVGTPCTIQGLHNFLKDDSRNHLYTIDIICHGVPVPKIYKDYINFLENKYKSKIVEFDFRDKVFDKKTKVFRHIQKIKATFENGKIYDGFQEKDPYYMLFWSNNILRESCYSCLYANTERPGDITIGDWWGNCNSDSNFFNSGSESTVIINSKKGEYLFGLIKNDADYLKVSENQAMQRNLYKPTSMSPKYAKFWTDYATNSFKYILIRYADYYGVFRLIAINEQI